MNLRHVVCTGLVLALPAHLFAPAAALASTQGPKPRRLAPVRIQEVVIQDDFWSPKLKVWREVTLRDCLAKFEKDGALANFDKIRDGAGGDHGGPPWYDGLIYEMIRAGADFLASEPDPALETRLDGYIERIAAAAAKDPGGYLNTYTQLKEPAHRWGLNGGNDNWQHDVYNAGAMVDAAVHYYRATGKARLLEVATRLANQMADVMGPPPRKNVVPGHSLGEEALVKLYLLFHDRPELKSQMRCPVDEGRYLGLAEFWIENRGRHEGRASYGSYGQDQEPVLQQKTIEGHAVRATLLCAGMVAAANVNGRQDYLDAALRLWENMVQRRMYVTGGLGAVAGHEGFGPDYTLPNDGYLETCAAVGAGFFHHNMNLAFAEARYADELERVLYNGILSGVSLKGDTYFYENPLEAGKNRTRWAWHGCPCCPPMFLKIMGALPGCIYAQEEGAVYVNLFIGSRATLTVNGAKAVFQQTTRYPWDGAIRLSVQPEGETEFAINVRLPAWCEEPRLTVNGNPLVTFEKVRGYARLQRKWRRGDGIELSLPMPVQRIKAHPKVEADLGRVALQRGPIVYCLEAVDNGGHVRNLVIPPEAQLSADHRADMLGGVTVIRGLAAAVHRAAWPDTLYLPAPGVPGVTHVEFTAIPYFANANRQPGEMRVWMAEAANQAEPLPAPTLASGATPSASHCWQNDSVSALNDQIEPAASDDTKIPRFTWWDHRGTREWVQYDFDRPEKVSAVEVYWWDERRIKAHCRVPQSWRLLYQTGGQWKPVAGASAYTTEMDRFNRVTFDAVETKALRIEVQLQPEWSGGLLEWRVETSSSSK
ncbi:MAG: glycoside hydrolase family 127 protein [Limisphaerales bacterium]